MSKCRQPRKSSRGVQKFPGPPRTASLENCKRSSPHFGTQVCLVSSRADHPHLIAERYWGPNTTGGCAGRRCLYWPGESLVRLTHSHTSSHLCNQGLRSQSHGFTLIDHMILNKHMAGWCSGSILRLGRCDPGSNPGPALILFLLFWGFFFASY